MRKKNLKKLILKYFFFKFRFYIWVFCTINITKKTHFKRSLKYMFIFYIWELCTKEITKNHFKKYQKILLFRDCRNISGGGTYSIWHLSNNVSKTLASKVPNNKVDSMLLYIGKPWKINIEIQPGEWLKNISIKFNRTFNIKMFIFIGDGNYCILAWGDSLIYQAKYTLFLMKIYIFTKCVVKLLKFIT